MTSTVNILWTGGWDSTFRMVELAKKGVIIQPYYVIDKGRSSTSKELEVIEAVKQEILKTQAHKNTEILPLKTIEKGKIPFSLSKKISYKILRKRHNFGKQYYWLACFALQVKDLELGMIKTDQNMVRFMTKVKQVEDESIGSYFVVNPKVKGFHFKNIFGRMRFPILDKSKLDMKAIAEKEGFLDIMNMTWFCHKSTTKPCGKCNPCKQIVKEGLAYRLN